MKNYLLLSISFTTILTILSCYTFPKWVHYFFKPVTTLLIIALALISSLPLFSPLKGFVLLALTFSLFGDVFLMFKKENFVAKNKNGEYNLYRYTAFFNKNNEFLMKIQGIDFHFQEDLILDFSEYVKYLVEDLEKSDLKRYKELRLNYKATFLDFEELADLIFDDVVNKISNSN